MPRPEILIVATIDAVGVTRLPRILSDAGFDVVLLGARKLAVRRSRFVKRWLDGPLDPAAMAAALRGHLESAVGRYRQVIVADEPVLWVLSQKPADWMAPWFPTPLSGPGAEAVFSKRAFAALARERGLPMPEWRLCFTPQDARQAAHDFGYPIVLKADHGLSGSGVRISRSERELEADFEMLGGSAGVLAQRFIDGPLGTTPVLFDHGRPVCWFSAHTREHWPTPFASSTALAPANRPEMESILEILGSTTAFNGLCGLDWVEDPATGQLLLLEMNPRPTPGHYLGPRAGVDFSLAIHDWLSGHVAVRRPTPAEDSAPWPMFPQALYRAFDDRRPRLAIAAIQDMPVRDPLLVAAHWRRVATHFARRLLKRKQA